MSPVARSVVVRRRVLATVLVGAVLGSVAGFGAFSAFSATTSSSANSFVSGTVKIDQHAGYSSLYSAAGKKPGETSTGCVRVTYSGSLAAAVRLYVSAGVSNGSAFNLKVERGSGLSAPAASMSCAGFAASSTVFDGALGSFASTWSAGSQAKPGGGAWAQNEAADYRFTITVNDDATANAHTTVQATGSHTFTWEARGFDPYPATVLQTPGLLSYWRLGEATGTAAYDSAPAQSANATYWGGPVLARPGLLTADTDTGILLDGVDDIVSLGDRNDFAGSAAFSVEAWVRPTSANQASYRHLVNKRDTDGNGVQGWDLLISSTTDSTPLVFTLERWRDGTWSGVNSTTLGTAGVKHHVVGTFDGSTLRMYIDGALQGTQPSGVSLLDTTHSVWFGDQLAGDLDDVSIYGRALSTAEVKQHYDRGNGS